VNVSALSGRPGLGRQAVQVSALCAVLVITLADLALSGEPIFGFVARFESTALGHQIGEAADLVFKIDWNEVGSGFALYDGRLPDGFRSAFGVDRSAVTAGGEFGRGRCGASRGWVLTDVLGDSGFCHTAYSFVLLKIGMMN